MAWHHIEDRDIKARKPHQCLLCAGWIETGERYLRRIGIEAGDGYVTMHMHPECEAQTADWTDMEWETFSPGDLQREQAR